MTQTATRKPGAVIPLPRAGKWSNAEDEVLRREVAAGGSFREIAARVGVQVLRSVTGHAVESRCRRLGIHPDASYALVRQAALASVKATPGPERRTVSVRRNPPSGSGLGGAPDVTMFKAVSVPSEPWDVTSYLAEVAQDRAAGLRPVPHRTCAVDGCRARVWRPRRVRCDGRHGEGRG